MNRENRQMNTLTLDQKAQQQQDPRKLPFKFIGGKDKLM